MLRLVVNLGENETPASFVSRLAANHDLTTRDFCLDWKVLFQQVVDGDPVAITKIADLGGVSPEALMANAFVRTEGHSHLHRGQILVRKALRRSRVHVCAACCLGDIAAAPTLRPVIAPYGRGTWQIDAIKTCPTHQIALTEITNDMPPSALHDFARHMAPTVSKLHDLVAHATRRQPSQFERYVMARLAGAQDVPFLDGFPLYAASKICELIGAVAEFGRTANLKRLTDDDWWLAGGAGFEIAAGGIEGIHEFLARLQATYPFKRPSTQGPQALFGRLYQVLAFGLADEVYDRVRDVIADYAVKHLPLGPDDEIFGRPVARRTLHSIRTLSVETGLHPKRLRKVLKAAGITENAEAGLTDQNTVFPAEKAILAVSGASTAVPLPDARNSCGNLLHAMADVRFA